MSSVSEAPATGIGSRTRSHAGALLIGLVLLIVALSAAVSIDVVRAGYGVKGDEATYVGMALSLAYDGDLTFERRDLERFWGLYRQGPEGIFLKRGRRLGVSVNTAPPFVHIGSTPDPRLDRAYFGKAMIYAVAAAPFVRLFGMNGFFILHVLLIFAVLACGYRFLVAQSHPAAATAFVLAFVGASAVPVQAVYLAPEILNFALVFVAYFCWLYQEASPDTPLAGAPADLVAAALLGAATYSKPLMTAPLVLPLVLLPWIRRQWWRGLATGVVSVGACAALFGLNAVITGDWNYQGGERKQFYSAPYNPDHPAPASSGFPFDTPEGTWDVRGKLVATDDLGAQDSLKPSEVVRLLRINSVYFLFGRHFGLVPYFFPGVVAVIAWLVSRQRRDLPRLLTMIGIALATLVLLVVFPYTWSGGGGPPGNRYYMSIYPAFFFLTPAMPTVAPALVAWIGGSLFTATMLLNPFVSAKNTWQITERGFARRLPVEVTMANDLPVMLAQGQRGGITYSVDPVMKLYFLDQHATPPETDGMWVSGDGRADIIVRTVDAVQTFEIEAFSPIATSFTVSIGAGATTKAIPPGEHVTFRVPASGVQGFRSYAYLLSAQSSEGFVPRLVDPTSHDDRNLGVQMKIRIVSPQ